MDETFFYPCCFPLAGVLCFAFCLHHNLIWLSWVISVWSDLGWTVCDYFGLHSSLDKCYLVALVGVVSHLLESSVIFVVVLAGLPWLLCMSLKFIVCGIFGGVHLWWNFCPCCPVAFCSSDPYWYGWPKL